MDQEIAHVATAQFLLYMQNLRREGAILGSTLAFDPALPTGQMDLHLDAATRHGPALVDIWWGNPGGRVIAAANRRFIGRDLDTLPGTGHVRAGNDWHLDDLDAVSYDGGRQVFPVTQAVHGPGGELRGLLAMADLPELGGRYLYSLVPIGATGWVAASGVLEFARGRLQLSREEMEATIVERTSRQRLANEQMVLEVERRRAAETELPCWSALQGRTVWSAEITLQGRTAPAPSASSPAPRPFAPGPARCWAPCRPSPTSRR